MYCHCAKHLRLLAAWVLCAAVVLQDDCLTSAAAQDKGIACINSCLSKAVINGSSYDSLRPFKICMDCHLNKLSGKQCKNPLAAAAAGALSPLDLPVCGA
jgi:hypothetical protein